MTKKSPPPAKPSPDDEYYAKHVSEDVFIDKFIATLEKSLAEKAKQGEKTPVDKATAPTKEPSTAPASRDDPADLA